MSWIESHQALEKHPKTLDLAQRMGWTLDETIGKLHRFWWWCLDYATDGDLRKHSVAVLAGSVGIPSASADDFLKHMVEARWIDQKPYRRIHDWWEYVGRFLQVRYKHNPVKWQEVRDAYKNGANNGSTSPGKHRSKNHIPTNLNQPTLTNQPHPQQAQDTPPAIEREFEEVWNLYPKRNGKRVGRPEALAKFRQLKPEDHPLVRTAVRNYASSEMVQKGIGVKDPHRWLRNGKDSEPWRDWITPEEKTKEKTDGKGKLPHSGFGNRDYETGTW